MVARQTVIDTARLQVDVLTLESSGHRTERHLVVHPGAVVGLPILDDGRVVLIANHRFAADATLWELPAGTLELGDEEPAAACRREVEEETGYRARRVLPLLGFFAAPGVSTEFMHVFVCDVLEKTSQALDEVESITVHPMELSDALSMIRRGDIIDAKTVAALLYYAAFGVPESPA